MPEKECRQLLDPTRLKINTKHKSKKIEEEKNEQLTDGLQQIDYKMKPKNLRITHKVSKK